MKPCEYCDPEQPRVMGSGNMGLFYNTPENKWYFIQAEESDGIYVESSAEIRYCPMCGRELKGGGA